MATCKDCEHYEVCMDFTTLKESEFCQNYDKQEDLCDYFKNKADFVEVKHGEWIEEEDEFLCSCYACSNCKESFYFEFGTPKLNGANYCFNCGAKMNLKEGADNG